MKRVCSWCGVVIAEGSGPYAGVVTYGICLVCMAKVDGQIAALERLDLTFPCPSCPRDATPYKVASEGERRMIHVRCPGCGLAWIVEAHSSPQAP